MKIHHFDGIYQERWGFSWAMLVSGRVDLYIIYRGTPPPYYTAWGWGLYKSLTWRRFCYSELEPILSLLTAIVILKRLWQIRSSNTIFQSIIWRRWAIIYIYVYIWSFTTSHWTPSLSTSSTNPQRRVHFNWKIASSPGTEPMNRLRKDISVVNLRAFLLNQPCQVLLAGQRESANSIEETSGKELYKNKSTIVKTWSYTNMYPTICAHSEPFRTKW